MSSSHYWFRAKQYGWGWSWPLCWQGWLALLSYLLLMFGGLRWNMLTLPPGAHLLYSMALTILFIAICWLKGEPPKWRWGDKDTSPPQQ